MEFTANTKELKSALEKVNQACKKSSISVTTCVKLTLSESVLSLTGYDLETGITTSIPVEDSSSTIGGKVGGEILVECSKLLEIVSKYNDEVSITVDDAVSIMTIKSGRSKCRIGVLNADDYPKLPEFESKDSIVIKADILADMIKQTIFAVSVNDNKPILTGECFTVKDKVLEVAAIDGLRLAVRSENIDSEYNGKFVVKADALRSLLKLLKSDAEIKIIPCRKHVIFDFGETKLFSRLLEGDFHNYKSAIPTESTTEVAVNVKPLIEALERFSLLINDKAKAPLACEFHDDGIYMSLKSTLGEMQDIVSDNVNFIGNNVRIGFNCRFLLEALKATESDRVKLILGGAVKPMTIKPIDGDAYTFLVLPIRLRD
ncbi:MAG: DNA polymerase III subunit beta [Oscillospiraceae bacterium]